MKRKLEIEIPPRELDRAASSCMADLRFICLNVGRRLTRRENILRARDNVRRLVLEICTVSNSLKICCLGELLEALPGVENLAWRIVDILLGAMCADLNRFPCWAALQKACPSAEIVRAPG